MKILILASSSFAATGLRSKFVREGHEVWTFNRSRPGDAASCELAGSYDDLATIMKDSMGTADVLVNFAIVKNGSIEANLALADQIMSAARALGVKRLIHISSISVLPSVSGVVSEDAEAVNAHWKGVYSRIKAAVEQHVIASWKDQSLEIVRPGFILAPGVVDSMVGIGRLLPSGYVLGLGNRRTVIMLVHRDTLHAALVKLTNQPIPDTPAKRTWMLVAPNAPERKEYLDFQCSELGRGWSSVHFPAWLWRVGLWCASPLLSILKRRQIRLATLFEHNLKIRKYDCTKTSTELDLDIAFDWKKCLRDLVHAAPSPTWPSSGSWSPKHADRIGFVGMGRIVMQKHLPGLLRNGFKGKIDWQDPALQKAPAISGLEIASEQGLKDGLSHVIITAPWTVRSQVLNRLPDSISHILLEKPLAVSRLHLDELTSNLSGRHAAILHNYRFKPNVLKYREFLRNQPSGALLGVTLHYETPSPANEQSSWMKQERRHRIVLCDYALHFLDLSWIFCTGEMRIDRCQTSFNDRNELECVNASLSFDDVPCSIRIRSGCHQRQCIITHHFQNYSAELRFFPDVFVPFTGGKTLVDDARLAWKGTIATGAKILEKLGLSTSDLSHDLVLKAFVNDGEQTVLGELTNQSLHQFYLRLTTLADRVYGTPS